MEDEDYFRNYRVHLIDGIDEEIDKVSVRLFVFVVVEILPIS